MADELVTDEIVTDALTAWYKAAKNKSAPPDDCIRAALESAAPSIFLSGQIAGLRRGEDIADGERGHYITPSGNMAKAIAEKIRNERLALALEAQK